MKKFRLENKRIVITQSDKFMGPDIKKLFEEEGGNVFSDTRSLVSLNSAKELVNDYGHIDVLIINLAAINPKLSVENTDDENWKRMFDIMVHPLHWLVKSVVSQMKKRRKGKIVVIGSASALRGMKNWSSYASARGAQLSYVKSTGVELAPYNIQINAIAQTFVENPSYFSKEYIKTEEFKNRMKEVPINRLATGREDAYLALFLASDDSNFIVGQTFPFAGGWIV